MMEQDLTKEIPYGHSNMAVIKRDGNPWGFFVVRLQAGVNPKEFDGYFTSLADAERAVNRALQNRKPTPVRGSSKNAT